MKKDDLVTKLHEKSGVDKKDVDAVLKALPDVVVEALKEKDTVQIMGLGTFRANERAAREGKNPQTGEKMQIAASVSIGFKTSAPAKRALNNM